jgi:hypothetical protein
MINAPPGIPLKLSFICPLIPAHVLAAKLMTNTAFDPESLA